MPHRRRNPDEDSLDLLLDTICNVFGGIVFIAILIAILTSNTTEQVDEGLEDEIAEISEQRQVRSLRFAIDQQEETLARLNDLRDEVSDDKTRKAADFIASLENAESEAEARVDRLEDWLRDNERAGDAQTQSVTAKITSTESQIEQMSRQLRAERAMHTMHVRLPIERRTEKKQIILLLQSGRVHLLHSGPAKPLLDRIYPSKDTNIRIGPEMWEVTPLRGGGFVPVVGDDQPKQALALLHGTDADMHFFDMFVAPDSVQAFRLFRDAAVHRGFRYNVHPFRPPLILGAADSVTAQ